MVNAKYIYCCECKLTHAFTRHPECALFTMLSLVINAMTHIVSSYKKLDINLLLKNTSYDREGF